MTERQVYRCDFDVGLGDVHNPTKTAAWYDINNDGHLESFNIGNERFRRIRFGHDGRKAFHKTLLESPE